MSESPKFPAAVLVHGAGQSVYACERHAVAISNVLTLLGASCNMEVAEEGHECSNCVNEAKLKK